MEIPRHWRLKKIRYGDQATWDKIIQRYNDPTLNPHLSLALLASDLDDSTLDEIHDRVKEGVSQKTVYQREK